jgi:hypothetical protein
MDLREVDLTEHVHRQDHRSLVWGLAKEDTSGALVYIFNTRTTIGALEIRLTKLFSIKWQRNVKGLLFDYLQTRDASILEKAEISLNNYEYMERLSLLELAVWKAACISHAGQVEVDSKTSVKTFYDAILCAAKHQHTWKKYRTDTRKSNAIEIIIKHVIPFLGKP